MTKERRVTVTLELITTRPLAYLGRVRWWEAIALRDVYGVTVLQAQANVIRSKAGTTRARPRKRRR